MEVSTVLILEQAKRDVAEGELFYDQLEPGVGLYFRDSIIGNIESLVLYAGVHSRQFGLYKMLSDRFPYAIYYTIKDSTAIIVAVLDMRRKTSSIASRLKKRFSE